jgi:hypothetical protein
MAIPVARMPLILLPLAIAVFAQTAKEPRPAPIAIPEREARQSRRRC